MDKTTIYQVFHLIDLNHEEQQKFRHKYHNAFVSSEYAALVSLNNACECYIQRRPCKKINLRQMSLHPTKLINYDVFCENENGNLPTKQDIMEAYLTAVRFFGEVPSRFESLFQKAMSTPSKSGRPKTTMKERVERAFLACTLSAVAKIEKKYNLGFFPIRTREEARIHFYRLVLGENAVLPTDGAKDLFNLSLTDDKSLRHELTDALETLYRVGFFKNHVEIARAKGTLPTSLEGVAWWANALLKQGIWLYW